MTSFVNTEFLRLCFEHHQNVIELIPDRIPYIDLTYCITGRMKYIFEGEEIVLTDGDAILFPQGSVRQRLATAGNAFYCSFNISHEIGFVPVVKGYLPKSMRSDTVSILESAKKAFTSVSEQKCAKCTSLFWYLYYQLIETAENNENPHVKQIKQYIAEHITEPMTLSEISDAVHLVPHYCCSVFSKQVGQTLFEFIASQRIEMAKSLIRTTDLSLTDISANCGFSDYNYFSRVFKKQTGFSPLKYKKTNTLL